LASGRGFQHRHLRAEPAMRLRKLEPDRPAADDDEMLGTVLEIEDRLVGEIRRLGQARDRRHRGDEPVAITKRRALTSNLSPTATVVGILEARRPFDHLHAEAGEALLESFGAIAAMTPCTCACTLAKSISARGASGRMA
jgi:hypothetical protein